MADTTLCSNNYLRRNSVQNALHDRNFLESQNRKFTSKSACSPSPFQRTLETDWMGVVAPTMSPKHRAFTPPQSMDAKTPKRRKKKPTRHLNTMCKIPDKVTRLLEPNHRDTVKCRVRKAANDFGCSRHPSEETERDLHSQLTPSFLRQKTEVIIKTCCNSWQETVLE